MSCRDRLPEFESQLCHVLDYDPGKVPNHLGLGFPIYKMGTIPVCLYH